MACGRQEGEADQESNAGLFWDQAANWLPHGTCRRLVLTLFSSHSSDLRVCLSWCVSLVSVNPTVSHCFLL